MKSLISTLLLSGILFSVQLSAQKADDILGIWLNEKKDGKINVFKKGGKYYGKIIWLKYDTNEDGSSPKLDNKNPDAKLRKKPIVGTLILKDLIWDEDDTEWDDGEIYDPRSGNTYSLFAKIQKSGSLYLKGYIGFSLLGRSTVWTKVK